MKSKPILSVRVEERYASDLSVVYAVMVHLQLKARAGMSRPGPFDTLFWVSLYWLISVAHSVLILCRYATDINIQIFNFRVLHFQELKRGQSIVCFNLQKTVSGQIFNITKI